MIFSNMNISTCLQGVILMTKRKFSRKRILVSVEDWNPRTEETKHISVWDIDKDHLNAIHKLLKEKFEE